MTPEQIAEKIRQVRFALQCLYIAVDEHVARDVDSKVSELIAIVEARDILAENARLRGALESMLEATYVPDANCSCHISPPCDDCIEFSMIRESRNQAQAALAARGRDGR